MAEIIVVTQGGAEDLPIASTTDPGRIINSDDYALFENVPVFVEHERQLKNGRILQFGRDELQKVADRSNRRIEETGDFCPVVIGHTSEEDPKVNPPKIGWAGPFRIGWLTPAKDKYAILADFRIEKDKVPLLKEYPRRSAEIWAEEQYEDMYLDPISLLGAETPWSDMGVLYAKNGAGVEKVYYSIAPQAPGAYTGLPKPVKAAKKPTSANIDVNTPVVKSDDSEKEKYSMDGNSNGLSTDQQEIAQAIVTTILNSPEFSWIRREMQTRPVEEVETNAANPLGQEETVDVIDETQEPEKKKYEMGADAPMEPDTTGVDGGGGGEPEQYAKEDEEEEEGDGESLEDVAEDKPADGIDGDIGDEDAALDDEDEENIDIADVEDDGSGGSLDDLFNKGAQGDLSLMDESFSDEDTDEGDDEYFTEDDELAEDDLDGLGEDVDSTEEENDMTQIEGLKREVAELRAQIKKLTGAYDWAADRIVSQERYAKIADLRSRYVFDDAKLRQKCRYNRMKNAEFEAELESIRRNNRPIPTAIGLPRGLVADAPAGYERPGAVQYSKEKDDKVEEEVRRLSDQYAAKGVYKKSDEIRKEAQENCGARR